MRVINTVEAPKAIGPFSQGTEWGGILFVSGQLPINPQTGELACDIKVATRQSLNNMKAILEASESSMDNVLKVNIFLDNMDDFGAVNEVYGEFFKEPYPARACVAVKTLPKNAIIEIECIAHK